MNRYLLLTPVVYPPSQEESYASNRRLSRIKWGGKKVTSLLIGKRKDALIDFLYHDGKPESRVVMVEDAGHGSASSILFDTAKRCVKPNDSELFVILNNNYDLTHECLEGIFKSFDFDHDGVIDYPHLLECIEILGLRFKQAGAFEKLCNMVDPSNMGGINLETFIELGLKIKMATLIREGEGSGSSATIKVSHFNSSKLLIIEKEDHIRFFHQRKSSWAGASLINITKTDALTICRIAVKYQIHPLAMMDALDFDSRPTFERYEGHAYISVPFLLLRYFGKKPPPERGCAGCCGKKVKGSGKSKKRSLFSSTYKANYGSSHETKDEDIYLQMDDEKDPEDDDPGTEWKPSKLISEDQLLLE
jgi:hypothetical protein